jgi:hypothetical protein
MGATLGAIDRALRVSAALREAQYCLRGIHLISFVKVVWLRSAKMETLITYLYLYLYLYLSFMRDRTERVPLGFVPEPFDYPFKALTQQASGYAALYASQPQL